MKISTISTTRISLNFLIGQFYKLGIRKSSRLGPLVDGVHRIAQALITSRYCFTAFDGRVCLSLPLRDEPSDAERAYIQHVNVQINAHVSDHFKDGWQTVWVSVEKEVINERQPEKVEWRVEFRTQKDKGDR